MNPSDLDRPARGSGLPDGCFRGVPLYHGTRTTAAAECILRGGLRPGQATAYTHDLRPARGCVYVTPDSTYAVKHALGPDARTRSHIEYRDWFCYVFSFDGEALRDAMPDEDSVGEFLWLHTVPAPDGRGKAGWAYDEARSPGPDHRRVWDLLAGMANAKELRGCCTFGPGRPSAWAAFGKRVQPLLPDWARGLFFGWGAHVAYAGTLPPSGCWRIPRERQHFLAYNPEQVFAVAEKVM